MCRANVTTDEKLEGFRRKCPFRQYIPSKLKKYGIKIFAMVDSKLHVKFRILCWKTTRWSFSCNSASDVVLRLEEPIFNSDRNITADNWFASIQVVKDLRKKKLSYVGTIRKTKKELPLCFTQTK